MIKKLNRICVNCGSSPGLHPEYMEMAGKLGKTLAEMGIDLVYGGSDVGLMGEVANAVLHSGGKAIGVIPKLFANKVSHPNLTELYIVDTMHERKTKMFELSDGFIALPGGLGTIEEVFEILTWAQLGLHEKPCGLLNVRGYYDNLLQFLNHAVDQRFVKQEHRKMMLIHDSPEELLNQFKIYEAPVIEKWQD